MDATGFGSRLKELRESLGLSQKQLAEKAKVSQKAISNWEQGLREPSWPNVVALAEAFGIDCSAFLEDAAARPAPGPGRPKKTVEADPAAPPKPQKHAQDETAPASFEKGPKRAKGRRGKEK
jgi:transcriptional regulator with XRE-family HTH domain